MAYFTAKPRALNDDRHNQDKKRRRKKGGLVSKSLINAQKLGRPEIDKWTDRILDQIKKRRDPALWQAKQSEKQASRAETAAGNE